MAASNGYTTGELVHSQVMSPSEDQELTAEEQLDLLLAQARERSSEGQGLQTAGRMTSAAPAPQQMVPFAKK